MTAFFIVFHIVSVRCGTGCFSEREAIFPAVRREGVPAERATLGREPQANCKNFWRLRTDRKNLEFRPAGKDEIGGKEEIGRQVQSHYQMQTHQLLLPRRPSPYGSPHLSMESPKSLKPNPASTPSPGYAAADGRNPNGRPAGSQPATVWIPRAPSIPEYSTRILPQPTPQKE